MARLNDTEGLRYSRNDSGVCDPREGSCRASANPNAGEARCASYGYRPNVVRNPSAGSESIKAAAAYLRGGIR